MRPPFFLPLNWVKCVTQRSREKGAEVLRVFSEGLRFRLDLIERISPDVPKPWAKAKTRFWRLGLGHGGL